MKGRGRWGLTEGAESARPSAKAVRRQGRSEAGEGWAQSGGRGGVLDGGGGSSNYRPCCAAGEEPLSALPLCINPAE